MSDSPLLDTFFSVGNEIAEIQVAIGGFDAIADSVDQINASGLGGAFFEIQSLQRDYWFIAVARLVEVKRNSNSSMYRLSCLLKDTPILDASPIRSWLNARSLSVDGDTTKLFLKTFPKWPRAEIERIVEARHKFVAHKDSSARWEDLGVKYQDIDEVVSQSYDSLDCAASSFLKPSTPGYKYSKTFRKTAISRISTLRRLITFVVDEAS